MFSLLTGNSQRFTAMAVWPFIISKLPKDDLGEVVVNHEKIHFRQQLELLFVFFFVWYGFEYFIRLAVRRNKEQAYRSIGFEKEAYGNETDKEYLRHRRPYSWLKFM